MESKYISKKTNETAQYVYTNDVYDLTINYTNGNLAPNLEAKGNDAATIMRQLVEDLSTATVKLETLMNIFSEGNKNGMFSEEVSNDISTYIYGTPTESSKKSK